MPSGIGAAVSLALARAGCTRLLLADSSAEGLERTAMSCSTIETRQMEILTITCDVGDAQAVDSMVGEGVRKFGAIHYCVNCAGTMPTQRGTADISFHDFMAGAEANQRWVSRALGSDVMAWRLDKIVRSGSACVRSSAKS